MSDTVEEPYQIWEEGIKYISMRGISTLKTVVTKFPDIEPQVYLVDSFDAITDEYLNSREMVTISSWPFYNGNETIIFLE